MFVEGRDFFACIVENIKVVVSLLELAVGPVCQKCKIDFATRIGEIVHFKIADMFIDRVA